MIKLLYDPRIGQILAVDTRTRQSEEERKIKRKKGSYGRSNRDVNQGTIGRKHQRNSSRWNWKLHANHKERRSLFLPLSWPASLHFRSLPSFLSNHPRSRKLATARKRKLKEGCTRHQQPFPFSQSSFCLQLPPLEIRDRPTVIDWHFSAAIIIVLLPFTMICINLNTSLASVLFFWQLSREVELTRKNCYFNILDSDIGDGNERFVIFFS